MAQPIARYAIVLCLGIVGQVRAADQAITGVLVQVKDPQPGVDAARRSLTGHGREATTPPSIVGDPTQAGASITFFVNSGAWTSETFALPQGTDPQTGRPFWRATRTGFVYGDMQGTNGPVRAAHVRTAGGAVDVKAVALGRLGTIGLVPPNPGAAACMRLDLGDGDSYHVLLPPAPAATISRNDARRFVIRDATVPGFCPPPSSTTTSTPTTSSTTTSTNPSAVCGNGVREPGEQCDGGPTCTAGCVQTIPSCCSSASSCISAPLYTFDFYLYQYCLAFLPGSSEIGGGLCGADGSCVSVAIDPVPMCCQLQNGTCYEFTQISTSGLWHFQNFCRGSETGTFYIAATCGSAGACLPQ